MNEVKPMPFIEGDGTPTGRNINKVEFGGRILLDLTEDTVSARSLLKGETAHDKTGAAVIGIATSGDALPNGTKWEDSNITIGNYYSLAEIAGVCVAANYKYGPGLVWSDDGKFWHEADTHGVFHEVISANGVCVAVSIDTGLFFTYDGKHWKHSNVTTGSFRTVGEYCGRFVAAGKDDGGMWWSDDGETWEHTNVTTDGFRVVTATNGRWIASGNTTGLWWSDDGKTWTQSNISTGQFYCVATAGSLFLAGSNGKGVYWSEDAKTWNQSTLATGGARWICVYEGLAMAAMWGQGLWWSEDGKTWNQSNVTDNQWMYISGGAGILLASGWHPGMWWSTDGKTWKPSNITSGNFHPTKIFKGVWVLGCGQIGLKYSPVWSEYARPLQEPQVKTQEITANGDYEFEADPGKTLAKAIAKVNIPAPTGVEKTVEITANGLQEFPADPGTLMSKLIANVNVSGGSGGIPGFSSVEVEQVVLSNPSKEMKFSVKPNLAAIAIMSSSDVPIGRNQMAVGAFVSDIYSVEQGIYPLSCGVLCDDELFSSTTAILSKPSTGSISLDPNEHSKFVAGIRYKIIKFYGPVTFE